MRRSSLVVFSSMKRHFEVHPHLPMRDARESLSSVLLTTSLTRPVGFFSSTVHGSHRTSPTSRPPGIAGVKRIHHTTRLPRTHAACRRNLVLRASASTFPTSGARKATTAPLAGSQYGRRDNCRPGRESGTLKPSRSRPGLSWPAPLGPSMDPSTLRANTSSIRGRDCHGVAVALYADLCMRRRSRDSP